VENDDEERNVTFVRSSEVSHDDMRAVGCKRLLGCRSAQG